MSREEGGGRGRGGDGGVGNLGGDTRAAAATVLWWRL